MIVHVRRVLSGGGGDQGMFPPQDDTFPPQNKMGNYTGIALFLITLQVLESLVVLLKYMIRVLKAKAGL